MGSSVIEWARYGIVVNGTAVQGGWSDDAMHF